MVVSTRQTYRDPSAYELVQLPQPHHGNHESFTNNHHAVHAMLGITDS